MNSVADIYFSLHGKNEFKVYYLLILMTLPSERFESDCRIHQLLHVILFTSLAAASVQDNVITCNFHDMENSNEYVCEIWNNSISDVEHHNITIGGTHLPGRHDDDVTFVDIIASNLPTIVPQLFTRFRNMIYFRTTNSRLTRLTPKAFINAENLIFIIITQSSPNNIPPLAFVGATTLFELNLFNNGIQTEDENAFIGMNSLNVIDFEWNDIRHLPVNTFRPLLRLRLVFLGNNKLYRLDGAMFANNHQLQQLSIPRNEIYAIGRNFLDSITEVRTFNLVGNLCVNGLFMFVSTAVIREALITCFDNYENSSESVDFSFNKI